MTNPCVAVIVGSNQKASINRKLAEALTRLGAEKLQFSFVQIDDLPLYSFDMESDWPAAAERFNEEVARADAVLIVTPEHNRSLPAVLKNAIDWGSRSKNGIIWRDKPVAMVGAARGAIGTA